METRGQVKSAGAGAKVFELLAREPQVTSERYGNSQWLVALGGGGHILIAWRLRSDWQAVTCAVSAAAR
jgi:hypothetical protein